MKLPLIKPLTVFSILVALAIIGLVLEPAMRGTSCALPVQTCELIYETAGKAGMLLAICALCTSIFLVLLYELFLHMKN